MSKTACINPCIDQFSLMFTLLLNTFTLVMLTYTYARYLRNLLLKTQKNSQCKTNTKVYLNLWTWLVNCDLEAILFSLNSIKAFTCRVILLSEDRIKNYMELIEKKEWNKFFEETLSTECNMANNLRVSDILRLISR